MVLFPKLTKFHKNETLKKKTIFTDSNKTIFNFSLFNSEIIYLQNILYF